MPKINDVEVSCLQRNSAKQLLWENEREEISMERKQWMNNLVNAMLVDLYQITMAYAYWLNGSHEKHAVFDLFFRHSPFKGEYSVYCGLEESLRLIEQFRFSKEQIDYIRKQMPGAHPDFFKWLAQVDCSKITVYAIREGNVVFPRVPLLRVEGPLAIAQLLESVLLNLNNFGTLSATNAARHRRAAGPDKVLLEFGLRRAQGPDGAITASRNSYIGGFDATSNVQAGYFFDIPIKGTHAHAFVQSFRSLEDLMANSKDASDDPMGESFVRDILRFRKELEFDHANEGELAAFIAYARAFPDGFLALVDTYDTLKSGVPNFICVARGLSERGFVPRGIRIDSGDLAYISREARKMMDGHGLQVAKITASNDINEAVLLSLNQEGHAIDAFGIGTSLVTCQAQSALGGVYKLVAVDGDPRIKLSEDDVKITIPGKKEAYRLIGSDGKAIIDVLILFGEEPPIAGKPFFCRHPFKAVKRAEVTATQVLPLYECVWDGKNRSPEFSVSAIREYSMKQVESLRSDIMRAINPTPYKVGVSAKLYEYIQRLRESEAPIGELK
jgi:nicotinate phosphoribosyltransferase